MPQRITRRKIAAKVQGGGMRITEFRERLGRLADADGIEELATVVDHRLPEGMFIAVVTSEEAFLSAAIEAGISAAILAAEGAD